MHACSEKFTTAASAFNNCVHNTIDARFEKKLYNLTKYSEWMKEKIQFGHSKTLGSRQWKIVEKNCRIKIANSILIFRPQVLQGPEIPTQIRLYFAIWAFWAAFGPISKNFVLAGLQLARYSFPRIKLE